PILATRAVRPALSPRVRWAGAFWLVIHPPAGSPSIIPRLEDVMAQATAVSPQTLVAAARVPVEAYNDKDWKQAKAGMASDFRYEEMATARKATNVDDTLELWKGWADAFPDSRAEFRD